MAAQAKRNGAAAVVVEEPRTDALGDEGRAMLLAEMYAGIQEQLARLDLTQKINGSDDDDLVPGPTGPLLDATGAPLSYGRRRQQLEESEARARDAGRDVWPMVERVIALQREQRAKSLG